ncbi:MAG: thioredoxin-disulfide reductase [Bifidobacteriaceae bacterium]|jgi:thioredoxin reductase (NADPH)|nr:thioredoxin-disulfide reductase [Bifidobacteriaceae bacterium]
MRIVDVVIIGSGPAGYTAAIYLGRAGIKPVLVSGLLEPGGALMKTGLVENFPGFEQGIEGPVLMQKMQKQAEKFFAQIISDDVVDIDFSDKIKLLKLSDGSALQARAVIIASGAKYRHLDIPGEAQFAGKGVSYCATCDGFFFSGKEVIVVGGGDTAIGEAIFLSSLAAKVTVIHRRDQLRATKTLIDKANSISNIEFIWDSVVAEIEGDESGVKGIIIKNAKASEKRTFACQGVFIAIGHNPSTAIFQNKLDLDDNGYIKVKANNTSTSEKGVFAAGDCTDGKYRQAVIASAGGAKAALDVDEYLKEID